MRTLAMEFDSPAALKRYLHDHPGADRSKHTVKEQDEGKTRGRGELESAIAKVNYRIQKLEDLPKSVEHGSDVQPITEKEKRELDSLYKQKSELKKKTNSDAAAGKEPTAEPSRSIEDYKGGLHKALRRKDLTGLTEKEFGNLVDEYAKNNTRSVLEKEEKHLRSLGADDEDSPSNTTWNVVLQALDKVHPKQASFAACAAFEDALLSLSVVNRFQRRQL